MSLQLLRKLQRKAWWVVVALGPPLTCFYDPALLNKCSLEALDLLSPIPIKTDSSTINACLKWMSLAIAVGKTSASHWFMGRPSVGRRIDY